MLFNSFAFLVFLFIVYFSYWSLDAISQKSALKTQNILLLAASYVFYSFWSIPFCFLLIFSTLLDYFSALQIEQSSKGSTRKAWFWISIGMNLLFLGYFKYANFFIENTIALSAYFGVQIPVKTLEIILPIGISFYTFHGLSYVIDVYKGKIQSEKHFVEYALFVCFFPLLVAGPIERANHLLPQIKQKRTFDRAYSILGLQQMLWGFVKKIILADNLAPYVNYIFDHHAELNSLTLIAGAIFFAFQIYGDFSGYTDIALGTAKLFGFELFTNFSYPYFSKNIAEFWKRWHISLTSWFRDYLYIPLGGSRKGIVRTALNTLIVFLISGFWHGASWHFVCWGFLNALFILPFNLSKKSFLPDNLSGNLISIALTFATTTFCWIFFRANSVEHAIQYVGAIINNAHTLELQLSNRKKLVEVLLFLFLFLWIEWRGKSYPCPLQPWNIRQKYLKWGFYYVLIFLIAYFYRGNESFIYFQF